MNKIKIAVLAAVMFLTACEPISQAPNETLSSGIEHNYDKNGENGQIDGTSLYTEYVADVPEIVNEETSVKIEAEDCTLGGSLYESEQRKGFSGKGYVTGFYGGSADFINITAELETNQHYDITICAAADTEMVSSIKINGEEFQEITIKKNENFTKITLYGVYMEKGTNVITIDSSKTKAGKNCFDLDYIEITNNESIYDTDFKLDDGASNENISIEASLLLKTMKVNFGNKIITGQFVSSDENKELEFIYEITGKYPAIRFSDIGGYTSTGTMDFQSEIKAAKQWAEKGGIVGFMWYWVSPDKYKPSVYSKDTTFRLKKAVTQKNISQMPISEISKLYESHAISSECFELIKDIDEVSEALLVLADEDVPVLWRPLHEASGDWFWWGMDGAQSYKWLYNLMYDRMTNYHKLNNLIWIWNGQSEEYMVDKDKYDIAAIDVYLSPQIKYGSRSEQYQWLKQITDSGKLLALGECSSVPDIDEMVRDNSLWSFFGQWFGEYIMDKSGNISEIYTKRDSLIKIYNAENAVTLDKFYENG